MLKNLNGCQKWVDLGCGFEPHLSSSKVSAFKNDLVRFICYYGLNFREPYNAAMNRGIVVERWLGKVLLEEIELEAAIIEAIADYNTADRHYQDTSHLKQVEVIPDMIRNGYEALKEYGKPTFPDGKQEKLEFVIKSDKYGWEADAVGYLDFVYPEQGLVIDLKTTLRMPPSMSWSHSYQWAMYRHAKSNYDVKFCYITNKRIEVMQPTKSVAEMLEEGNEVINKMNNFCFNLTPSQAKQCIPIGDNFYGNNNSLKEAYNA